MRVDRNSKKDRGSNWHCEITMPAGVSKTYTIHLNGLHRAELASSKKSLSFKRLAV